MLMRVPRHLQLCRAAAGDGNSSFSGWEGGVPSVVGWLESPEEQVEKAGK